MISLDSNVFENNSGDLVGGAMGVQSVMQRRQSPNFRISRNEMNTQKKASNAKISPLNTIRY